MSNYLKHKPGSIEELVAKQGSYKEDSGYQKMFKKELDKAGKGIGAMSPKEKKDFFNKIDDKYKAKSEGIEDLVPTKKEDEIQLLATINSASELKTLAQDFGMSKEEVKKVL